VSAFWTKLTLSGVIAVAGCWLTRPRDRRHDALSGVAIAISLVPPLGVVGVCAGQGDWEMALGAFVLFASNMVAMVLAGTLTSPAYG